jgi:Crossover junction endodeoxyribonuclease RuvC
MNVGGLNPGVRSCGVSVVTDRGIEENDLWTLPVHTTQACARLHALMEAWVLSYNLEVVAVEDFHSHQQRGNVTTAKAMWQLLGVVRSLAGYRDVQIMLVQAGHWGPQLTGVRPPREQPGRRWDEWKRQVAWHVEREAGPTWSWVNDRGYHRRDSLGIAYYARAELRFRGRVAGALARQGKGSHEHLPPQLR